MPTTLHVAASTTLAHPVEEVWRFMAAADHLDTLVAHDSGDAVRKTSEGPLALGTTLELRGEFRGRRMVMEARISEFEPNLRLSIEYVSGPFRGSKKIYLLEREVSSGRTKIVHPSIGEFHGMWRVMAFLLRPIARKGLQKSAEEELAGIAKGLGS